MASVKLAVQCGYIKSLPLLPLHAAVTWFPLLPLHAAVMQLSLVCEHTTPALPLVFSHWTLALIPVQLALSLCSDNCLIHNVTKAAAWPPRTAPNPFIFTALSYHLNLLV